ncbi:helix-turn-helix domain-containing protein [Ktedonosporobacter rubrisoli]|uniref:Helix-turn-helix domain-containing protein n=1 Tax=Ktedonosporobacter rubrisoli TaxID=2509675 RepID=A0A4V0Z0G1_KTERU|nr:helix-turn-helix domain-containing protein [Ktedonosporobacter rubrisoli]QBD83101.1 helix-turn-helix domain-containing protein [Ktedonosporobacter rubrisoli]
MVSDEDFITIEQARAHLGISRRTLERYTAKGRIRRYRRGIRVYYRRDEVEQLAQKLAEYVPDDGESEQP